MEIATLLLKEKPTKQRLQTLWKETPNALQFQSLKTVGSQILSLGKSKSNCSS